MTIDLRTLPGFNAALEKETLQREAAFFVERESICGVEVLPLSARHYCILAAIGSPFVVPAGKLSLAEVARFLWVVSPGFSQTDTKARRRFIKRCRALDELEACVAIYGYIDDAFTDSPATSGTPPTLAFASWAADLVDAFAREYRWTEQAVLDLPFKRAFQYLRVITRHHRPDAIFFNPRDRIVGDYLRSQGSATVPGVSPGAPGEPAATNLN